MISLWTSLGRPAARNFALALLLSILSAVLGIALLGLSGWFLAAAAMAGASGVGHAFNHLYPSTGVRTLAIARVLSRYTEQLVGHEATLKVSASIRPLVFERLARAQRGLSAIPAGALAVIVDDVSAVEGGFLRVVGPALGVLAAVFVAIGWAAAISPPAALATLMLFLSSCVALPLVLLRRAQAAARELAAQQDALRAEVGNLVENAVELEIIGVLGEAARRANGKLKSLLLAQDRLQEPFRNAGAFISLAGGLAALIAIAWAILTRVDGAIAAGATLAILAAFEAASTSARILDASARAKASADRLQERLKLDVAMMAGRTAVTTVLPLRLDAASVIAGDAVAVGPISLVCAAGDIVELSGRSGIGKSTVLEAISALRPLKSGSLDYAGVQQSTARQASVLARVAMAPQFPSFLPGTLRAQLAYGRPDASDQEIRKGLAVVCMDDIVAGREDEDASAFSGGERRRLGIARALIVNPDLLLLDEPFAGLQLDLAERIRANLVCWLGEGARGIVFTAHEKGVDWAGTPVIRAHWLG